MQTFIFDHEKTSGKDKAHGRIMLQGILQLPLQLRALPQWSLRIDKIESLNASDEAHGSLALQGML
jgi:hypothetical protein